jgi:hypothetical protein
MTKQFTEITAITNDGLQKVNAIQIYNFSGYNFNGNNGFVEFFYGKLEGDNFTPIQGGSMPLPKDVVDEWAKDDSVVMNYVMNKLGL